MTSFLNVQICWWFFFHRVKNVFSYLKLVVLLFFIEIIMRGKITIRKLHLILMTKDFFNLFVVVLSIPIITWGNFVQFFFSHLDDNKKHLTFVWTRKKMRSKQINFSWIKKNFLSAFKISFFVFFSGNDNNRFSELPVMKQKTVSFFCFNFNDRLRLRRKFSLLGKCN